ncbi:hypothetical protein K402DRAFT_411973 [Aulographum hederae CBS 113979]|uniref:Mid2 domain-containing protein n=1 Tax=Aulographum hederae CBS 113979 TaxID=1176131 RepID=A0A6G1H3X0_9PEZI|nr:hypothetical protein K402DRAFT_411973 [Aulographum hederae CBS 113979]
MDLSSPDSVLIPRADVVCGGIAGLTQCGGSFPSTFCCGSDSTCLRLNSTGVEDAMICCPRGSDCGRIKPIQCDNSLFDAIAKPASPMHATPLPGSLQSCDGACCPLGYGCTSNGNCTMTKDNVPPPTKTPSPSLPISTATSTPGSTTTLTPSSVTTPDPSLPALQDSPDPSSGSSLEPKAVMAGFFPGILLGAFLALLILWLLKRRRDTKNARVDSIFGRVDRSISDPIYHPQYSARTDFLSRTPAHKRGDSGTTMNTDRSYGKDPLTPPITAAGANGQANEMTTLSSHAYKPGQPGQALISPNPFTLTPTPAGPHRGGGTSSNYTSGIKSPLPPIKALFSKSPLRSSFLSPNTAGGGHGASGGGIKRTGTNGTNGSTETIDVLMPAEERSWGNDSIHGNAGGAAPKPAKEEKSRPMTTFSSIMAAGQPQYERRSPGKGVGFGR